MFLAWFVDVDFVSRFNVCCSCICLYTGALTVERVSKMYIELITPNSLELEVTVDGAYSSLKWYRGGVELTSSDNVSITNFNQRLTIAYTSTNDALQYEVIGTNSEVNVSVIFEVQVFSEYIAACSVECI